MKEAASANRDNRQETSDNPLVWIMVLHYQGPEYTRLCLESLKLLTYGNYRVLMLDNGSPDQSGDAVAADFPQYDYVREEENLGFAGGCNAGVKYCAARGAEFVWLLNNDTQVHPDSLSKLVECAKQAPKAALIGGLTYTPSGDTYVPSGAGEIDFRRGKTRERRTVPSDCGYMSSEWISGCNLMVRLAPFTAVGGFDEAYFLYFEDTDLCYRIRQSGWECVIVPQARVDHVGLRSTQGSRSTWRHYYYTRNRLLFFRKYVKGLKALPLTIGISVHLARHCLVLPFRGERGQRQLKAELLGLRDYLNGKLGRAECLDW